jgi:hypothetical protein
MDTLPTRASFELAAKISVISRAEGAAELVESSVELLRAMVSIPTYVTLVDHCHNALHHCDLIQTCDAKRQALASIMSQIFAAGWAAGRQEIIDAELEKSQIFSDLRNNRDHR